MSYLNATNIKGKDLFSIVYHQIYIFLDKSNKIYFSDNKCCFIFDRQKCNEFWSFSVAFSFFLSLFEYVVDIYITLRQIYRRTDLKYINVH